MSNIGPLDGASPLRVTALTARFLLELALLAGVAVLAWQLVPDWWRWPAAVLALVAVAGLWGFFLSPKATIRLPAPAAFMLEALLFLGTGFGLLTIGFGIAAGIGVVVWIIDRIALAIFRT